MIAFRFITNVEKIPLVNIGELLWYLVPISLLLHNSPLCAYCHKSNYLRWRYNHMSTVVQLPGLPGAYVSQWCWRSIQLEWPMSLNSTPKIFAYDMLLLSKLKVLWILRCNVSLYGFLNEVSANMVLTVYGVWWSANCTSQPKMYASWRLLCGIYKLMITVYHCGEEYLLVIQLNSV